MSRTLSGNLSGETLKRQPLTARQRETLNFIVGCIRKRGYSPTVREIAAQLGLNTANGAISHLEALERKGYIRRKANASRAIQLIRARAPESEGVEVRAKVVSGKLLDVPQPEYVDLSPYFTGCNEDFFLVRVTDESLEAHRIQAGDWLVLRRARSAGFHEKVLFRREFSHLLGICQMNPITQKTFLRPLDTPDKALPNDGLTLLGILTAVIRLEPEYRPPHEIGLSN